MPNIKSHYPPIVMLLAAGVSARMGDRNKLLLLHKERPLITHSASLFCEQFEHVYIVTGFEAGPLKKACKDLDVNFIHNPSYQEGLGCSFKAGLRAIPNNDAPLMVALADQIFLTAADIKTLQRAYEAHDREKVIIPQYKGQRGHPILFPPKALAIMRAASPIMTGRDYINMYPQDCCFIDMAQLYCILDIDTPADARQHLRPYDSC